MLLYCLTKVRTVNGDRNGPRLSIGRMDGMRKFWVAFVMLASTGSLAMGQSPRPPVSSTPAIMMVHVRTTDMARTERFYRDVFGMGVTNAVSPREHILRVSGTGPTVAGVALLLVEEKRPNGGFLIQVPDIAHAVARVEAAGGKVIRGPRDSAGAGVRNAMISDSEGTLIELMQFV